MNHVIMELVQYVVDDRSSALVDLMETSVGRSNARLIAINIIGWLRRRREYKHRKPLDLDYSITWCMKLRDLCERESPFGGMFTIQGNSMNFSSAIPAAEQRDIEEFAWNNYEPTIMKSDSARTM